MIPYKVSPIKTEADTLRKSSLHAERLPHDATRRPSRGYIDQQSQDILEHDKQELRRLMKVAAVTLFDDDDDHPAESTAKGGRMSTQLFGGNDQASAIVTESKLPTAGSSFEDEMKLMFASPDTSFSADEEEVTATGSYRNNTSTVNSGSHWSGVAMRGVLLSPLVERNEESDDDMELGESVNNRPRPLLLDGNEDIMENMTTKAEAAPEIRIDNDFLKGLLSQYRDYLPEGITFAQKEEQQVPHSSGLSERKAGEAKKHKMRVKFVEDVDNPIDNGSSISKPAVIDAELLNGEESVGELSTFISDSNFGSSHAAGVTATAEADVIGLSTSFSVGGSGPNDFIDGSITTAGKITSKVFNERIKGQSSLTANSDVPILVTPAAADVHLSFSSPITPSPQQLRIEKDEAKNEVSPMDNVIRALGKLSAVSTGEASHRVKHTASMLGSNFELLREHQFPAVDDPPEPETIDWSNLPHDQLEKRFAMVPELRKHFDFLLSCADVSLASDVGIENDAPARVSRKESLINELKESLVHFATKSPDGAAAIILQSHEDLVKEGIFSGISDDGSMQEKDTETAAVTAATSR